jgi:thiamine biosynthesis protein ThiS
MGPKFIREAKALVMSLDGNAGVVINGEHRRVAAGTSLAQLIAEVGLDPLRVAVERNLEIVPRSTFGQVLVEDGDAYEIVHFVGGG